MLRWTQFVRRQYAPRRDGCAELCYHVAPKNELGDMMMTRASGILIPLAAFAFSPSGLSAQPAQAETNAVSCSRLNVNGRKPGELTVSVNGTTIGTFHGEAGVHQDLEPRMQAGINRVRLSFAAPGEPGRSELRQSCGASHRESQAHATQSSACNRPPTACPRRPRSITSRAEGWWSRGESNP